MSTDESWPGETPEAEVEESEEAEEPKLRVAADGDELSVPDDVDLLEGEARSAKRGVGLVVSRGEVETANALLEAALAELEQIGVGRETITVMAVPGIFELPLGAMALAKTRRYACIVALGRAVAGDLVTAEAASGLQLAALETGVPVAFGVATEDGTDGAAAAVRRALEMADLFQQLRATAQA